MVSTGRSEQILGLEKIVNAIAVDIFRRIPRSFCLDDLIQAGWIGAIRAVDRYDEKFSASLNTYARHVIWGAVMDYLREGDFLTRTQRQKVREEIVPLPVSLTGLEASHIPCNRNDDRLLSSLLAAADTSHLLKLADLSPRERIVVHRYGEDPTREIARDLSVSLGRVWQIHERATQLLRAAASRRLANA